MVGEGLPMFPTPDTDIQSNPLPHHVAVIGAAGGL